MSISSLIASNAYAEAAKAPTTIAETAKSGQAAGGANFGDMVTDYLEDAVATGKAGEVLAQGAVQGKADMLDVVTAISAAETTLQTVVAVRDKVIEAYESIIRMPI